MNIAIRIWIVILSFACITPVYAMIKVVKYTILITWAAATVIPDYRPGKPGNLLKTPTTGSLNRVNRFC